jgi:hypothetical protein
MPKIYSSPIEKKKKNKAEPISSVELADSEYAKGVSQDASAKSDETITDPITDPITERTDNVGGKKQYPSTINKLISICLKEADDVKKELKGKNRQQYLKIFENYRINLSKRDESIITGALVYLYDNSRVKSIDEETAKWMIGIYEIPVSQILSYTSKSVLEKIAKIKGLPYSGKKAEFLISAIRSLTDQSK